MVVLRLEDSYSIIRIQYMMVWHKSFHNVMSFLLKLYGARCQDKTLSEEEDEEED